MTMETSKKSTKHIVSSDLKTSVCVPYIVVSDLLPNILCRLPSKPLIQFSLVCKQWHTLITKDSTFHNLVLKYQKLTPVGLLVLLPSARSMFAFDKIRISFTKTMVIPPLRNLAFFEPHRIQVVQACNGLLLCHASNMHASEHRYYVSNPTTKQYLRIDEPHVKGKIDYHGTRMYLAFDPAKSPYYKIVAIIRLRIFIYSSNTRSWRRISIYSSKAELEKIIDEEGVYWNGAINWVFPSHLCPSFYLNIENKTLQTMPSVPMRKRNGDYCGESRGHLYFVKVWFTQIDIYEMKRDYSEWFITCSLNLPKIPMRDRFNRDTRILSVICGEVENDSFVVFMDCGEVIRCSFANNTFQKLDDIEYASHSMVHPISAFHYIESICSV